MFNTFRPGKKFNYRKLLIKAEFQIEVGSPIKAGSLIQVGYPTEAGATLRHYYRHHSAILME